MENERLLTIRELAEYLRLGEQTIYRMAKRGQLPAIRLGRTVRFRKATIDEWLEGKTQAEFKPRGIKKKKKGRR